jgi:hypothetical protein
MSVNVKHVRYIAVVCTLWLAFCAAEGCTWEQALSFVQTAGAYPAPATIIEKDSTAQTESPELARVPFGVGEHLEFSVNYNVLNAGTATMSVVGVECVDGHYCYKMVTTARSNSVVSTFFEVRDRVESFMDVRGLFSRKFEKHLREGRYKKDEAVQIDQCARLAFYADGDTAEILPETQDALSSLYFVRTMDLEVGQLVSFPNHSGKKNYPMRVRVLGREKIKTRAGKFNCLVVEPRMKSEGIFKHRGRLVVWITDDERRMPVKMKSSVTIGSITAELVKWKEGRQLTELPAAGETPVGPE